MERTAKIMGYLYSGLGYEYYTASLLWGRGFEAYKMEADFGFDIMAYNQKNRSFANESESKPYLFQVKMRREYGIIEEEEGGGIRRISEQEFKFRKDDFERLKKEEKSYVVCYFVDATKAAEEILGSFWLNNYQINLLCQAKDGWECIRETEKEVIIKAKIKTKASSKKEVLEKYDNVYQKIYSLKGDISDASIIRKIEGILRNQEYLKSWIERSSLINENTSTNVYLIGVKDGVYETERILSVDQTNFTEFEKNNKNSPLKNF